MYTIDTEPKYFISGLNNLQSKEKCDILRLTDISYLKEISMITLLSREDIVLNEKRILPSKVVTLYEQTEYNLDRLKRIKKQGEFIVQCNIDIDKAFIMTDKNTLLGSYQPEIISKYIKTVDYTIMHNIYQQLKSAGAYVKNIKSDADCIKEFILWCRADKNAVVFRQVIHNKIKAFPNSKYTKDIETDVYYTHSDYVKIQNIL